MHAELRLRREEAVCDTARFQLLQPMSAATDDGCGWMPLICQWNINSAISFHVIP